MSDLEKALQASLKLYEEESQLKLLNNDIKINDVVLPLSMAPNDKFIEYNYSDILLLPTKYSDIIFNNNIDNTLNVFRINNLNLYVTFYEFYDTIDEYIYVSDNIYNYIEDPYNVELCLYNHYLVDREKVIFQPLNVEFFDVKNQLDLFNNIIGTKFRILYNDMYLNVYSVELKKDLEFKIIIDDINIINDIIKAIDVDLAIDFQPSDDLIEQFKQKQEEKQRKLDKLTGFKMSTKTEENDCDDEVQLSREEVRQKRLEYLKKQGLLKN